MRNLKLPAAGGVRSSVSSSKLLSPNIPQPSKKRVMFAPDAKFSGALTFGGSNHPLRVSCCIPAGTETKFVLVRKVTLFRTVVLPITTLTLGIMPFASTTRTCVVCGLLGVLGLLGLLFIPPQPHSKRQVNTKRGRK